MTQQILLFCMPIHGYPLQSMGIHARPWVSMPGHGYSMGIHASLWVSMPIHGYPCQFTGITSNPARLCHVTAASSFQMRSYNDSCHAIPITRSKTRRRLKRTFAFSCCEHTFQAMNIQIICQQTMIGMKSDLHSLQSVEKFRGRMQA